MTDPTIPTPEPEADAETPEAEPGATAAEPETTAAAAEAPEAEAPEPTVAAAEPVTQATAEPVAVEAVEPRPRAPRGPRPYAVIETGGKQYRVSVGDTINVEKLDGGAGTDVTIERVLLLGGDGATRVGTPVVAGATVSARINDQFRGEKIVIFKYKPKKRYRKKMGHRQSLTRLEITAINA